MNYSTLEESPEIKLKRNISLVMEVQQNARAEYNERNLARICTGIMATSAGIFSAGTAIFEKYEASLAGFGMFAVSGTIYYFINKNLNRKKEKIEFCEKRIAELEEKIKNAQ